MNATEELVRNIVETGYKSIDKKYVERAKLRILDAAGCALAGIRAGGCGAMLDLVRQWGGAAESTLIASGGKAPAPSAAMANSLLTRSFDFEPVEAEGPGKSSPSHISGTTIPTALAMAEKQAAGGRDLITALVLGDDLASRLGVASGFDFDLGFDNTGFINLFGAAAIAIKLLKPDEKQVMAALGIALNQLSGSMAGVFDKTLDFKLPIAFASRAGITAAELAKRGYPGVKEPFFGPRGYFALYTRNSNSENLTRDLGRVFYADCVIKPYSACRATHLSIDCALSISRGDGFRADQIEKVVVHTTPSVASGFTGQPYIPGETPQVDGAFNIRYTVSTALLRKDVRPEFFSERYLFDPQILDLIEKISLAADISPGSSPAALVEVTLRNGTVLTGRSDWARGDFRKTPLTPDEIRAKYRANAEFSGKVPREKTEKALEMIENLEEVKDVRDLMSLLA